jgi:hypothetical protein
MITIITFPGNNKSKFIDIVLLLGIIFFSIMIFLILFYLSYLNLFLICLISAILNFSLVALS